MHASVILASLLALLLLPVAAVGESARLSLSGETRARGEWLSDQFRAGERGSDQLLALRTLLRVECDLGPAAVTAELQDSRGYFADAGSPLTSSQINPADLLQLNLRMPWSRAGRRHVLTVGRQTLSIGSRRQVERVEYANVIFSYTGAHLEVTSEQGAQWHVFAVVPLDRRPADRASLVDNRAVADREAWRRRFWALHHIRPDVLPGVLQGLQLEAYIYGLHEDDTRAVPTPNRDYLTPGLRVYRAPARERFDFELEAAWRHGSRRATSAPSDLRNLDVRARTVHFHLGWTFADAWRTRVSIDYDYASGDDTPGDERFDQYERLFGARRTDLGNTGIHGPLTPANLDAPGARIEIQPTERSDARLAFKRARLASARDAWVVARVTDPSGESGRSIGHTFDARWRWWIAPDRARLEVGASVLHRGRFAREAPNATREGDPTYAYAQVTVFF